MTDLEKEKYINVSERQIDFKPITESDFFESTEEMVYSAQEAEQVASHPLSNIYANNLRWALSSFNLFEFHTNFPITEQVLDTIEKTAGVESISQYTKYRGIISVGRLFDDVVVRNDIREGITKTFQKQNEDIEPLLNEQTKEED